MNVKKKGQRTSERRGLTVPEEARQDLLVKALRVMDDELVVA